MSPTIWLAEAKAVSKEDTSESKTHTKFGYPRNVDLNHEIKGRSCDELLEHFVIC